MALQGTLDTFELPDVLRLLASTKKSGRLHVQGDRGDGSVWLAEGDVVGVRTDAAPGGDVDDGLFDLLRAREGGFAFEPGVGHDDPAPPMAVEPLLASTEQRLAEWREIEAVVPSLHAWVSLVPELPQADVTVDAATWRLVATIGSGLTVGSLASQLDLPEVPVCRVVRDLVVLGLGVVTDAPAPEATSAWDTGMQATFDRSALDGIGLNGHGTNGHGANGQVANGQVANGQVANGQVANGQVANGHDVNGHADAVVLEPPANGYHHEEPSYAHVEPEPVVSWDDYQAAAAEADPAPVFTVDEPAGYGGAADLASVAAPSYDEVPDVAPEVEHGYELLGEADDADEVARQLAMLSPRAAQAVAAAAAADSDDERDAHLDAIDEGDEPINRGLLLKFLSSVKS